MDRDYRQTVCKFGEECIPDVLSMYEDATSGTIISFLKHQLSLHHPEGVKAEKDGAFVAKDKSSWRKSLALIYNNVLDTSINNVIRLNRPKSTKDYTLKSDVVDLGAQLLNQLFFNEEENDDTTKLVVTQIVPHDSTQLDEVDESSTQGSKRRKLELNFYNSVLAKVRVKNAKIEEEGEAIPWLQILTKFLNQFPNEIFNYGHANNVLGTLVNSLQSCRDTRYRSHLLLFTSELVSQDRSQILGRI